MVRRLLSVLALSLVLPGAAVAQQPGGDVDADDARGRDGGEQVYEATARARRLPRDGGSDGRSRSRVERVDLEERLPRSSPDALRYEPGVYVQQTAHGQGSAYIRGLTGQQTVIVFDGIRMNTSLYRQGPNQYFFTVDSATLDAIEVVRGSASVFYGSDALGGVLLAHPVEARRDPRARGLRLFPRGRWTLSTADHGGGFRLQLEGQLGPRLTALVGTGYRQFGLLESGGIVRGVEGEATGHSPAARVPLFAPDGRTMLGTGFREHTADARVAYRLARELSLTGAVYAYRELDAPRTDQCPPPFAPPDECLVYDEQFHTIASLALRGRVGPLRDVRVALSYQRQHELRTRSQPDLLVERSGRDDVDTFGLTARASSPFLRAGPRALARVTAGLDLYHDEVASRASLVFTDLGVDRPRSRGQYVDGSRYSTLGVFGQLELRLGERLTVRAGMRGTGSRADAAGDEESGTRPVASSFGAFVGRVGAEWRPAPWLSWVVNADEGFRAPNLDDLTSRQQTGPGFQFENPALRPERSRTLETGLRLSSGGLALEGWLFVTTLRDTILKELRGTDACPPETPQCSSAWSRIQLVNADGEAMLWGFEAWLRAGLPGGLRGRASMSFARGDVPSPTLGTRVPLSRVPPLNGTAELRWSPPGWRELAYVGAATRWALEQTRLAPSDVADGRIPPGGTRGYAVLDLRAGGRLGRSLVLAVSLENVLDAAYRVHGSSVNGPGRGLVISMEGGL